MLKGETKLKLLLVPTYIAHSKHIQLQGLVRGLNEQGLKLVGKPTEIGEGTAAWKELRRRGEFTLPNGTTHIVFTAHQFGRGQPRNVVYAARLRKIPIAKAEPAKTQQRK